MVPRIPSLHSWLNFSSLLALAATLALAADSDAGVLPDQPAASPADSARLQLKHDRVIVFKDGYCLVVKRGQATTDAEGIVYTDEVPDAAVLGSFWAVPEHGAIQSTVAGWVDTEATAKREINCTNILEIVKSNLGKTCSFEINQQQIDGSLLKILSNDNGATSGEFFIVRTQAGDKMIQASAVSNLTIANMNSLIEQSVTSKSRHKRLSMKFSEANTVVHINLMYFRPDVRWIPTYQVNLSNQPLVVQSLQAGEKPAFAHKPAELIMQGEILNEAEDFENVPFHVVVGVPNFRFRSIPSPMVLEATLRNALGQAAPDIMGMANNRFSNALYTQRTSEFASHVAMSGEAGTAPQLPDELIGQGGNDLFVYQLPPMTLKRGERALVPILRSQVVYRDIYTWDFELTHSENYAATSSDAASPLILSDTKVWRQIELINNTNIPWTTGAAMLVDGGQPLAQELLTYTSPGGICRVPVTVAVDLRGKAQDTEVHREFEALKWRGATFAQVEGKIEAELANKKLMPVTVEVRLRFGGKATRVSDNGTISLEAFRPEDWHQQRGNPINNSSLIRWTSTIQPGECFKPVVNYQFYLQY